MTEFCPKKQTPDQVDEGLRNAFRQAIKDGVMDATPYLKQMNPNREIELLKQEIKMLQSKLSFLDELEKTKSPVEEAYKDWCGQYPELETDSEYDDMRWQGFRAGYHFAYEEKVVEEEPKPKTLYEALDEVYYGTTYVCKEEICDVVERWLPNEMEYDEDLNGYRAGWNDCIDTVREGLR